jgi:hypothetical protein
MKSSVKIALASALLLSSLLIQGCSDGTLVKLNYTDDQFVNKGAKLCYNYAPLSYEPTAVGEAYAYCSDLDVTFCEIPGLDPKEWLTEEYAGAATTVLYSASLSLPTLSELDPEKMFVCLSGERVFSLATIEDEGAIDEIIRVFTEGEETVWPLMDSSLIYNLKFHSEKNAPGLYYNIVYGEFAEGNFLYEPSTGHCVEVGTLIQDLEV